MVTLMLGMLLVVGSAFAFGLALFGRRPVPQPAMSSQRSHPGGAHAEVAPSMGAPTSRPAAAPLGAADLGGILQVGWWRRLLQREPSVDHQPAPDVTLSGWTRARSAGLLTLIVVGLAAIIGALASILVVGVVLLVT